MLSLGRYILGLHTCINTCNRQTSSSLKTLDQFSPDFTKGLLSKGTYEHATYRFFEKKKKKKKKKKSRYS